MSQQPLIRKLPQAAVMQLKEQIDYKEQATSSMTLVQRPDLGITLFALDQGSEIRKHVTPGDALVQVLDGKAEITIGDAQYSVSAGESIVMPADIPHSLRATEAFKMLLVVVKQPVQEDLQ